MKKLPDLKTDKAVEKFVADADLTQFDLSGFKPTQFEFTAKDARVNMRLPEILLKTVKAKAARQGMPYQRFIRQILEQAVNK